ncbi:MAG: porin family protein [Muribaculaceae bacterium]|nr:porin family protein [Muribaculaceae bacterium]
MTKRFTHITRYAILMALLLCSGISYGQLRFGLRGGINVSELHFDERTFDSRNRTGFTGGVTAELDLPLIGLGLEASALYTKRNNELVGDYNTYSREYFNFPIHLKYKIGIIGLSELISPFLFTGPDFAYLLSKSSTNKSFSNRKSVTSWNVGGGVELVKHLQLSASYSIGLSKAMKYIGKDDVNSEVIEGKDKCWTITAAYFF